MTTTNPIDRDEVVAKALTALEELRQLDICDPLELTRPFRQFAAQLVTIAETLSGVEFAAEIDAEVRRRVENVLEEMSVAARLVETAARSTLRPDDLSASAGVRTWFESALTLPDIYMSLTSIDVICGDEPSVAKAAAQVEAEIAELRDAAQRGEITITVPRTNDA